MNVCMCLDECVSLCVCSMYVSVCIGVCVCMCVCVSVCLQNVCFYMCVCVYVYVLLYVFMCTCLFVCLCEYMCIDIFPLPAIVFQLVVDLQYQICEVIKSLVRTERNQQVMCEVGLPHELLARATITLADEQHTIHPPLQYIFERLAAQSLTPKDLRLDSSRYVICASESNVLYCM